MEIYRFIGFEYDNKYVAAFDLSSIIVMISFILIYYNFVENYGVISNRGKNIFQLLRESIVLMIDNKVVLCVGIIQSTFESSMYIFVFIWTKALENSNHSGTINHGEIFTLFMLCCFIGTKLSKYATNNNNDYKLHINIFKIYFIH